MSAAELKQLQQTEGSPLAIARESVLTGEEPDPLLVETSGLELKRLLDLLPRMEVRGGLLRIRSQEDPETKWQVVCPITLREPVAWEVYRHKQDDQASASRLVLARYDGGHTATSEHV